MNANGHAQISYCNFPPFMTTTKFYTCYKKERCCDQGCCINGPYQIYQVWYYWLIFLIVFGIISGGSWLCKKPRTTQSRPGGNAPTSTQTIRNYAFARCSRRRCPRNIDNADNTENGPSTTCEENIILDRLFVSFRNNRLSGNMMGDPPSYSSIHPVNYSGIQPKLLCPLYSFYGPPPTYSSMYKTPCNNPRRIEGSSNMHMPLSIPTTDENLTRIQIHAEETESQTASNSASGEQCSSNVPTNSTDVENRGGEEAPTRTSTQNQLQANTTPENV